MGNDIRLWRKIGGKPTMVEVIVRVDNGVDLAIGPEPLDNPPVRLRRCRRPEGVERDHTALALDEYRAINVVGSRPDPIGERHVGHRGGEHVSTDRAVDREDSAMTSSRLGAVCRLMRVADFSLRALRLSRGEAIRKRGHRIQHVHWDAREGKAYE